MNLSVVHRGPPHQIWQLWVHRLVSVLGLLRRWYEVDDDDEVDDSVPTQRSQIFKYSFLCYIGTNDCTKPFLHSVICLSLSSHELILHCTVSCLVCSIYDGFNGILPGCNKSSPCELISLTWLFFPSFKTNFEAFKQEKSSNKHGHSCTKQALYQAFF